MVVLQWLKDNDIERLYDVCQMGRQAKGHNIVVVAVLDELNRMVRAVAIEDQKPMCASRVVLGVLFEMLDPFKTNEVIGIASRCHSKDSIRRKLLLPVESSHVDLAREDQEGRQCAAASRDSFHCSSRFAILWHGEVVAMLPLGINKVVLANTNAKASLIHIPDILLDDAILSDSGMQLLKVGNGSIEVLRDLPVGI